MRQRRCFIFTVLILIALGAVDLWFISAGRIVNWPRFTGYYAMLADAFLHGQTSLLVQPRAELLALDDPYDPEANVRFRLHDAVLYDGKYYVYWGPAPALLLTGAKAIGFAKSGDHHLVYFFKIGVSIWIALILHLISKRFADPPYWIFVISLLAAGLSSPMLVLLTRPSVYEAAILGGQFFMLGGIYWALCAVRGSKIRPWHCALAGAFWSMALASRLSLAPLMAVLAAAMILHLLGLGGRRRIAIYILAPMVCAVCGLAMYNHARFGSISESGVRYMLASSAADRAINSGHMFSVRYVRPNLWNYLAAPLEVSGRFPCLRLGDGFAAFDSKRALRRYKANSVAGLCVTSPYLLLALIPAVLGIWNLRNGRLITAGLWLAGIFVALAPILLLFNCTIRYLADFAPMLAILSTLGAWRVWEMRARRGEPVIAIGLVALAAWSIATGAALSFTGYTDHFPRHHPQLMQKLESAWPNWE